MTTSKRVISDAMSLSAADRLEVIDRLWESLAADPESLELTDAHRRELDRRLAELDADPGVGVPWDQIKAERRRRP